VCGGAVQFEFDAESVREFQPRVASTLGTELPLIMKRNSEGVASPLSQSKGRNSFRVAMSLGHLSPQGFKANPGLEFANAFSVHFNGNSTCAES
jgi:hypothetical protein